MKPDYKEADARIHEASMFSGVAKMAIKVFAPVVYLIVVAGVFFVWYGKTTEFLNVLKASTYFLGALAVFVWGAAALALGKIWKREGGEEAKKEREI